MDILFKNKKLEKQANERRRAEKELGTLRAKLYLKRLNELRDAECLEDVRNLPGAKYHELKGDLSGVFACNVDQPYRLLFEPLDCESSSPTDWSEITAVKILKIDNYHD